MRHCACVSEVVVEVWIMSWEIECCRESPLPGQPWEEIVFLGGGHAVRADGAAQVLRNADGSTTVIGVVTRRLGSKATRCSVVDAGALRVLVRGDLDVGATYEVSGSSGRIATASTSTLMSTSRRARTGVALCAVCGSCPMSMT